jgi:hypothetical protein
MRAGAHVPVKIATWNLARVLPTNTERCAEMVRWLDAVDADVWVLTETHDSVSPGPGYSAVSTGQPDRPGEPGERWATIWSRLPIDPLPPTRDTARSVAALVRPTTGRPLIVYGTVLPWLGSRWRDFPADNGVAFRAALAAQLADWITLVNQFPNGDLCVIGDFNQDLSRRYYYGSRANRTALLDALASVRLSALTADPSDPVRALAPLLASIDHICVPTRVAQRGSARLELWPPGVAPNPGLSDHFGVAADLGSMAE